MPTAYNTTVNLYQGVPLVKGGTEVLYLSGAAAAGVLGAYLKNTYTQYYYTRENRGAIQVEDVIQNCEGCNYVGFQNNSHGGKWYFGFVDRIVYINDNTTQIEFTIDPFPTYLGDCDQTKPCFLVRNTPDSESRIRNVQSDFMPDTPMKGLSGVGSFVLNLDATNVYFTLGQADASPEIGNTGIHIGKATAANVYAIHEYGGEIIGCYMMPASWAGRDSAFYAGTITGNPLTWAQGFTHQKLQTGVYNKLLLATSSGSRYYDLELFGDPTNVTFTCIGLLIPQPALFVYPNSYNGVADNTAEGVLIQFPSLPIAGTQVYTIREQTSDAMGIVGGTLKGVLSGAMSGGVLGAILGGGGAYLSNYAQAKETQIGKTYEAPIISGSGSPAVNRNNQIIVSLICSHPHIDDARRIDGYFDYYGYAINEVCGPGMRKPINTDDDAYLQTGDVWLAGSEADVELNARLMGGIKIRKTL